MCYFITVWIVTNTFLNTHTHYLHTHHTCILIHTHTCSPHKCMCTHTLSHTCTTTHEHTIARTHTGIFSLCLRCLASPPTNPCNTHTQHTLFPSNGLTTTKTPRFDLGDTEQLELLEVWSPRLYYTCLFFLMCCQDDIAKCSLPAMTILPTTPFFKGVEK